MKRALLLGVLLFVHSVASARPTDEITRENVLALMNAQRQAEGVRPLRLDDQLNAAAEDRMRDMEDGGWWSHESPEGRSPFVWLIWFS